MPISLLSPTFSALSVGLALLGDYADLLDSRFADLVDYKDCIAVFCASVDPKVDLLLRAALHGVPNSECQVVWPDLVHSVKEIAIPGDSDKHGVLSDSGVHPCGMARSG
jgi:hypothetical protein